MITVSAYQLLAGALLLIIGGVAVCNLCYHVGHARGRVLGVNEGWRDCFIEKGRRERKRHRPNGQFASKEEITQ